MNRGQKKFSKSAGTEQNLDSKTIKHLDNGLSRNVCIDQNKSGRLDYFYRTKKLFLDHCVRNWRRTPRTLRSFFFIRFFS